MSEMKKYLFVGGKADGNTVEIENDNHGVWKIPYIAPPLLEQIPIENCGMHPIHIKEEIYRKVRWVNDENDSIEFFALNSMSSYEIMKLFFENYQPKKDNDIKNRFREYEIMLERCVEEFGEMVKNPFRFKETIEFVDKICEFLQFRRNKN